MENLSLLPAERIETKILFLRGKKVMLDLDLAELYQVPTKVLNQAVRRNQDRFPEDFMFQLDSEEWDNLKSQFVTSSYPLDLEPNLRSQFVTSSFVEEKYGGRRYLPFAFTEQGVAMLSSVLRSKRAIMVNIQIMRTFTRIREMIASHHDLELKLEALEQRYDQQFKIVFDAIRELLTPPDEPTDPIGFRP